MNKEERIQQLFDDVVDSFKVSKVDLLSRCRKAEVVAARAGFSFVAYNLIDFRYTLTEIGKHIDRNHSTVVYYTRMAVDSKGKFFNKKFERMFEILKAKYIDDILSDKLVANEFKDDSTLLKEYLLRFARLNVKWTDEHEKLVDTFINSNPFNNDEQRN